MKLRVLRIGSNVFLYCANGSIKKANDEDLIQVLTGFSHPRKFRGSDGFWNYDHSNMEDAAGETLAYVDDANHLVILNEKTFAGVVKAPVKYISVTEYADLHNKDRGTIKKICASGKIPGAYKTSSGWLIPEGTPYPARKPRATKAEMARRRGENTDN